MNSEPFRRSRVWHATWFLCALLLLGGCSKQPDVRPLDKAGMDFRAIRELRALNVTDAEVLELTTTRAAGLSDNGCIELLRLARSRNHPLASGEDVARLLRADISEAGVIELARLDQLGLWVGNVELMRLAGISEETIMVVARRRAENLPVMSGAAIAQLKNAGLSESAVRELARRGINDDEAKIAFSMRRRGVKDVEILRRFPGR